MFKNVELLYGFNQPEPGFIWSQYRFGLRFDPTAKYCILNCRYYGQQQGTLLVGNSLATIEFPLCHDWNCLQIAIPQDSDQLFFEVTPRIQFPQDIRELGILVAEIHTFGAQLDLAEWVETAKVITEKGIPVSYPAPKPPETNTIMQTLYSEIMHCYVRDGWVRMSLKEGTNGSFDLSCVLWPPQHLEGDTFVLSINGLPQFHMEFKPEVDVDRFCARPEGSEALKVCIDLGSLGLEPDKVDFGVFDTKTQQTILDWQAYHWRGLGPLPLPGKDNILRIAGDITETAYAFTGATWFTKLCRLAERYSGRQLHEFEQILDWGCGCGRILRYFDKSMQAKVVAVDIDPVNIQWCRDHMPDSTFVLVDPDTPMRFDDNSFDLIYGHSVFTHLSEHDQNSWLAELRRVLKPGGFFFTTVTAELGWFACFSIARDSWQLYDYISKGIRDSGHVQIGVDIQKPGFYRNTAHTSKYIKSHWGKYFEILDILDGFADFQSLVVMYKPNPS